MSNFNNYIRPKNKSVYIGKIQNTTSADIARLTEEFVKNGGKITVCPKSRQTKI